MDSLKDRGEKGLNRNREWKISVPQCEGKIRSHGIAIAEAGCEYRRNLNPRVTAEGETPQG
jgi:hypothetical protein